MLVPRVEAGKPKDELRLRPPLHLTGRRVETVSSEVSPALPALTVRAWLKRVRLEGIPQGRTRTGQCQSVHNSPVLPRTINHLKATGMSLKVCLTRFGVGIRLTLTPIVPGRRARQRPATHILIPTRVPTKPTAVSHLLYVSLILTLCHSRMRASLIQHG